MYAAGLLLMVFAKAVPGGLQIAGFLAGIGTAGTGFGVLIGTVSRATPPEKRSQTIGLVAAAGSLGTMVLAPERIVQHVDAVVIAGGSAFGLAACDGAVRWCEEQELGVETPGGRVPIVVGIGADDHLAFALDVFEGILHLGIDDEQPGA